MEPEIRACLEGDLEALVAIGRDTFDETFRSMNAPETIEAYLAEAFTPERVRAELQREGSEFYLLLLEGLPAGYLKLNEAAGQSDLNDPESLEIERIYVRKGQKGKGLGKLLMTFALERAAGLGKRYAWLGVWERNEDAIAFYRKAGFEVIGEHSFRMGEELQTDYIMRKELR
jgi:diamine N-acetyltransferase